MRLAIIGVMCSGKTTIADYLVNNHNFRKLSFADDVKKYANEIFNLKNKNRRILQQFSSKMKEIDNDIWIKRLDIKLKMLNDNDNDNIVIDDLRFENELEYLKNIR
jgi:adenylate kinase family enzyme